MTSLITSLLLLVMLAFSVADCSRARPPGSVSDMPVPNPSEAHHTVPAAERVDRAKIKDTLERMSGEIEALKTEIQARLHPGEGQ